MSALSMNRICVSTLLAVISVFASDVESSIIGNWKCNPYTLKYVDYEATGYEEIAIKADGTYVELETSFYFYNASQVKFTMQTIRKGIWEKSGNLVKFIKFEARVLNSDNPKIPINQLQEFENKMMSKNPSVQYVIISSGEILKYRVLNADTPEVSGNTFECRAK